MPAFLFSNHPVSVTIAAMYLLVRNTVKDFETWRAYLAKDLPRAEKSGIRMIALWQDQKEPNQAFFILEFEAREQVDEFMAAPESVEGGEISGVIEGEVWYLDAVPFS